LGLVGEEDWPFDMPLSKELLNYYKQYKSH
jgi:hypothetical protein